MKCDTLDKAIVMKCNSLDKAIAILREKGIKFDQFYEHLLSKPNQYGMEQGIRGVHVYFNNGNNWNVAYYTPGINVLTIIPNGGRMDSSIGRNYLWKNGD